MKKNIFLKDLQGKSNKIYDELIILKDEVFRENLIDKINNQKIQMSHLLGTLQARVEEDIEIKEFKRANFKIQKRAKEIEITTKKPISFQFVVSDIVVSRFVVWSVDDVVSGIMEVVRGEE